MSHRTQERKIERCQGAYFHEVGARPLCCMRADGAERVRCDCGGI